MCTPEILLHAKRLYNFDSRIPAGARESVGATIVNLTTSLGSRIADSYRVLVDRPLVDLSTA